MKDRRRKKNWKTKTEKKRDKQKSFYRSQLFSILYTFISLKYTNTHTHKLTRHPSPFVTLHLHMKCINLNNVPFLTTRRYWCYSISHQEWKYSATPCHVREGVKVDASSFSAVYFHSKEKKPLPITTTKSFEK